MLDLNGTEEGRRREMSEETKALLMTMLSGMAFVVALTLLINPC